MKTEAFQTWDKCPSRRSVRHDAILFHWPYPLQRRQVPHFLLWRYVHPRSADRGGILYLAPTLFDATKQDSRKLSKPSSPSPSTRLRSQLRSKTGRNKTDFNLQNTCTECANCKACDQSTNKPTIKARRRTLQRPKQQGGGEGPVSKLWTKSR